MSPVLLFAKARAKTTKCAGPFPASSKYMALLVFLLIKRRYSRNYRESVNPSLLQANVRSATERLQVAVLPHTSTRSFLNATSRSNTKRRLVVFCICLTGSGSMSFSLPSDVYRGFPTRMAFLYNYIIVEIYHSGRKPSICTPKKELPVCSVTHIYVRVIHRIFLFLFLAGGIPL